MQQKETNILSALAYEAERIPEAQVRPRICSPMPTAIGSPDRDPLPPSRPVYQPDRGSSRIAFVYMQRTYLETLTRGAWSRAQIRRGCYQHAGRHPAELRTSHPRRSAARRDPATRRHQTCRDEEMNLSTLWKRNPITIVTGAVLVLIFVHVVHLPGPPDRSAVVTTLESTRAVLPTPASRCGCPGRSRRSINSTAEFRTSSASSIQTITKDQISVVISVYIGWRIVDPKVFLESFSGDNTRAEQTLEPLVRNAKSGVISKHAFKRPDLDQPAELKFDQVESEMLKAVQAQARSAYGIQIELLGIKRLQLRKASPATYSLA